MTGRRKARWPQGPPALGELVSAQRSLENRSKGHISARDLCLVMENHTDGSPGPQMLPPLPPNKAPEDSSCSEKTVPPHGEAHGVQLTCLPDAPTMAT